MGIWVHVLVGKDGGTVAAREKRSIIEASERWAELRRKEALDGSGGADSRNGLARDCGTRERRAGGDGKADLDGSGV